MSVSPERTDAELVRVACRGDRDAYCVLVTRHQERLYRRALVMVGDPDLAADMVQDAFVRAYVGLRSADPDRFAGWLHRILRNVCLDELRAPRHRVTDLPDDLTSGLDPGREMEQRVMGETLGQALAALGPNLREAFVLKHVDGLSYQEMADHTGVATGALKMRVKRAREALQRLLQPMEP